MAGVPIFRRLRQQTLHNVSSRQQNLREPWHAGPRTIFAAQRLASAGGMLAGECAKQYGANET
ncbi:hypothetical protein BconGalA64_09070 [Burkholderia contaminans]|nr:hypothetical protein BconGalA64_09070 [Burkholderia contaminans]